MSDRIVRLVGVYDADGSVRGELSYFVRSLVGRAHCALCDITHGRVRERAAWRACNAALPAPVETFHRDDQPAPVRAAVGGALPVVVAELEDGSIRLLLDRDGLEACDGDPERLVAAISDAVDREELAWPEGAA